MEKGGGSKSPVVPEDSQLNELSERVAENVVVFQQFVDKAIGAVDQDENLNEMTAESYDQKKYCIKRHLQDLSNIHDSLVDQYCVLMEKISMNRQSLIQIQDPQSSVSSSSPQASTSTGGDALLQPDGGGFNLAKGKGPSHSGLKSSVPPLDVAALKVKETKNPGFRGSESSKSYVNNPAVNDDALKVEETEDHNVLVEKISNLEDEVESLKQKLQSLKVENGALKQEVKETVTDIKVYKSDSKLEIKAMKEELRASKQLIDKTDGHMCRLLAEKLTDQSRHDAEILEMNSKMNECMSNMLEMQRTHEKKEKIWNDVTEQLKQDLKVTSESFVEECKNVAALESDKSAQDNLIVKLKAELISAKFENAGLYLPSDNVEKLTDELKLKVEELEIEVDRQMEAMADKDRK
ncbi:hypothetical protein QVD17_36043 [Tagetes erecta]|uniref:NAB domain-containing protein n=1 Tax=Tagetes erecta TaxID=13708 RepID=A0AAD8NHS0_TARER|nr:hypothetical protein QVD17_36043 [Tagetes erecta]